VIGRLKSLPTHLSDTMIEQLQWFLAVMLVILAAVCIGAAFWFAYDLLTGGIKRAARLKRCAMPKRIANLMRGH
jgi:hypothetical protein